MSTKTANPLKELEDRVKTMRDARSRLVSTKSTADATVQTLRSQLRTAEDDIKSYQRAIAGDKACPECGQKVAIAHLKAKLDEAKASWDTLDAQVQEAVKAYNSLQTLISEHDKSLRTIEERLRSADVCSRDLADLKRRRSQIDDQSNPHKTTLADLRKRLDSTETQLANAKLALEDDERSAKEFEIWQHAFKEIRLQIIDETLQELSITATRHAEALGLLDWKIELRTERETKSGQVSLSFTVLLWPAGEDAAIKFESYSGGESQRLQLAIAFGLSEVLLERAGVDPNIEVYDEPTRGLSAEGVDQLLKHLRERAIELERAIYVTEHHSLESGLFDDVITIVKDKEGAHIT